MKISVVIPAYNEQKRIKSSLDKILVYLLKKFDNYEIIVVDDFSSDNTNEIVKEYKNRYVKIIRNKINEGKGYSIKRGILSAKYPLVLFTDSDLATPIEELDKLLEYINKGFDIVVASRNLKDSDIKVKQPFYRQLAGKIFPIVVRIAGLSNLKDTQCGFKLFKTTIAKKIFKLQTLKRYTFDVEILFIAKKMGFKIKEVPVIWIDKKGSKVHLMRDSARMFVDLFKIKINDIKRQYQR